LVHLIVAPFNGEPAAGVDGFHSLADLQLSALAGKFYTSSLDFILDSTVPLSGGPFTCGMYYDFRAAAFSQ
jgi:hypothetical protein